MKLPSEIAKTLNSAYLNSVYIPFMKLKTVDWFDKNMQYVEFTLNGVNVFKLPDKYRGKYGVLFAGVIIETNLHFTDLGTPKNSLVIVVRTATSAELLFFIPRSKELVQSISDFIDDDYLVSYQDLSDFIDAQTTLYII